MSSERRIGRYTLHELLGQGGFAQVWRATLHGDGGFNKPVAVKLLRPDGVLEPSIEQALVFEAHIGARLQHANIVEVYEFTQIDGEWLMAMQLVIGDTLETILDRHPGGLAPSVAEDIVRQIASGLAHAHAVTDEDGSAMGLIHRDLKPANVMVGDDGVVKVLDFGIALGRTACRTTAKGMVKGTAAYMSPEQASGRTLMPSSDIWALGAIAYECLTGRPLIPNGDLLVMLGAIGQIEADVAADEICERSPALGEIVRRALSRHRSRRPKAHEISTELGGTPAPARGITGSSPTVNDTFVLDTGHAELDMATREAPRPRDKKRWLIAPALLVAAAIVGWILWPQAPFDTPEVADPALAVVTPDSDLDPELVAWLGKQEGLITIGLWPATESESVDSATANAVNAHIISTLAPYEQLKVIPFTGVMKGDTDVQRAGAAGLRSKARLVLLPRLAKLGSRHSLELVRVAPYETNVGPNGIIESREFLRPDGGMDELLDRVPNALTKLITVDELYSDEGAIQEVMNSNARKMGKCWQKAVDEAGADAGSMMLSFRIVVDGTTQDVGIADDTIENESATACIIEVAETMRFPLGVDQRVSLPLEFSL